MFLILDKMHFADFLINFKSRFFLQKYQGIDFELLAIKNKVTI